MKIIIICILLSIYAFSKDEYISIQEMLKSISIESKKYLPKKIDENLIFDKIEADNKKLIFYYITDNNYSILDLNKNNINMVCNEKSWIFYLRNGISLEYLYFDKKGHFINKYIIQSSNCN